MEPKVDYLPDRDVDAVLDEALRALLTACFTKSQDVVFRWRRYFVDPYPHRWVIRDSGGRLVAHTGVHEKTVIAEDRVYRVGGLGEVCVHPDYRGRGHVRAMLACVHDLLAREEFDFAMLFGDAAVYGSSGYRTVDNIRVATDRAAGAASPRVAVTGMIRELRDRPWPSAAVYLPGGTF